MIDAAGNITLNKASDELVLLKAQDANGNAVDIGSATLRFVVFGAFELTPSTYDLDHTMRLLHFTPDNANHLSTNALAFELQLLNGNLKKVLWTGTISSTGFAIADNPDIQVTSSPLQVVSGNTVVVRDGGQTTVTLNVQGIGAPGPQGPAGTTPATTTTSAGTASVGNVPVLNARGKLDPSVLTGSDGYVAAPIMVCGNPATFGDNQTTGTTDTPVQIVANSSTYGLSGAITGNHGKGYGEVIYKTRGSNANDLSVACQSGDRVYRQYIQATTSFGQTGHVGVTNWVLDGTPQANTAGELPGKWSVSTGTGYNSTNSPAYYGTLDAIVVNARQQMFLPGANYAVQISSGANTSFAAGSDFGAVLRIGPGSSSPSGAPLRFDYAHSTLLTTPEAGAIEVDVNNQLYVTDAKSVRRKVMTADSQAPTVAVDPAVSTAGSGATASIVWSGSGGRITITTGSGSTAGCLVVVTFAHPYATDSFPVICPVSKNALALGALVSGPPSGPGSAGFQVRTASSPQDNTTYVFNFSVSGI